MELNRDEPEIEFYLAYYMENEQVDENGEMNIKLKTVLIPISLKEKFLETFKDKPNPTKKEIFRFLDDNE